MKKCSKLILGIFLVASVFTFAGCKDDKKDSDGKIVLTVWESANGPDEFIKQAGAAFTAQNPNIEIKYEHVGVENAAGQLNFDGPAGLGPDLFAAPHDKLSELIPNGLVLPVANPEKIKDLLLDVSIKGATYNGTMYGYPVSTETYALYYNKALISENELPKTWEELAKWSKAFSEKNPGKFGFVVDVENPYYTIGFVSGKGNRLFGENGDDLSSSYLNTPKAIEGMEIFQSLRKSCIDCPSGDLSDGVVDSLFASGSVAMHMSGPWYLEYFANAGIDYGIVPLPSMPGEPTPSASFSTVTCMFVSAYSEHPEEAAAFAEFLLSEEMQLLRYKLTGGSLPSIPTNIKDEFAVPFLEQLKYAYPMPVIDEMTRFWDVFSSAASNIWNGADVKTELDAANATIIKKIL